MDRPTCGTCPFWDGPDEVGTGICRRHAPKPAKRSTEQDKSERFPVWPRTIEDEWCGEHPGFPAWIASLKSPPGAAAPELLTSLKALIGLVRDGFHPEDPSVSRALGEAQDAVRKATRD